MSDFRTLLYPISAPTLISHNHTLFLIGSCFTEHISEKLRERKFNTLTNPFGIVYNPSSMFRCLRRISATHQAFTQDELFEKDGLWHSWEHHGSFSRPDQKETLEGINLAYQQASVHLKKTDFLLLTFGTSDVYTLRETGQVVANNHKMPAMHFIQHRLSLTEMVDSAGAILQDLKSANAGLQVILTLSPVRHLRNGLVENQRSKAALVLACEELCKQLDYVHYFPAYELMIDDLRDYRFYASDMVHPSEVAVDYIWKFFSKTYFSENTRQLIERIEKILAAAQHRPFHPDTDQHRAFMLAQMKAIYSLKQEAPGLDFSAEEAIFAKI